MDEHEIEVEGTLYSFKSENLSDRPKEVFRFRIVGSVFDEIIFMDRNGTWNRENEKSLLTESLTSNIGKILRKRYYY